MTKYREVGIKIDGLEKVKDTWYKYTSQLLNRKSIYIHNKGVGNKQITGNVFVTFTNDGETENKTKTNPQPLVLAPGSNRTLSLSSEYDINYLSDENLVSIRIEESAQEANVTLVSTQ